MNSNRRIVIIIFVNNSNYFLEIKRKKEKGEATVYLSPCQILTSDV